MKDGARIRSQLAHPIVDGDGHWMESLAVLTDYLRQIAGSDLAEAYTRYRARGNPWYQATHEERMTKRMRRSQWWSPAETFDRATSWLPALLKERLDDLGIDFAIVYPTNGLGISGIAPAEVRQAVHRAYNKMAVEAFAGLRDRLEPVAVIPVQTPDEAISELDYAVNELGMKAIMIAGQAVRPIPAFEGAGRDGVPTYVDFLGLDSPYDYDPLWRRCQELKIAVTSHGGSRGWHHRMAVYNYVFNHVGHFADAGHGFAKALFLGGVPQRFPDLNFVFLEGGVGWARQLMSELIGHWEKRNYGAMQRSLRPDVTDFGRFRELLDQYAYPALRAQADELLNNMGQFVPPVTIQQLVDREHEALDDFRHIQIDGKRQLAELYARRFFFGCEADDPLTMWAFDPRMGVRLKAMFSSDIAHWDVPDMAEVVPEAYEMREKGYVNEEDFKDFVFGNAVRLHGGMNPDFFKGTVVEQAAGAELGLVRS